ncbi:MAG TPA: guanylate kinase [Desulfomicrobiaceae bacterium]|nr:guanylate kinase [Desulfomicrobiaceae bacterium]
MNNQRTGTLLVISAPSGAGKSTLIARLRKKFPGFGFSVSCTTRPPREGEVDGKDYHFITKDLFLDRISSGSFAEWAEVHGNYYGTPKQEVLETLAGGRDMILDIDVQGARQVRENMGIGCFVFLFPPSREALKARLVGRGTDSEEVIARRLVNAEEEIRQGTLFDHWIVNDDLDRAFEELKAVYVAAKTRPVCNPTLLDTILAGWRNNG